MASGKRAVRNAAAVKRDLVGLPTGLAQGALATVALTLAGELDDPETSATAKGACAKVLMEALAVLRDLAPPAERKDGIDDIADELASRRARVASGGARAPHPKRP